MTDRLARGSLPWPAFPAPGPATARPVCCGSLTVEAPLAPGARLRITAWPRSAPDARGGYRSSSSLTRAAHAAARPRTTPLPTCNRRRS
jgi:hypothetical protein